MGKAAKSSLDTLNHFDIDNYLNYIIPRPRWHLIPKPISFWFGYRPPNTTKLSFLPSNSNLLVWLFSFLGAFIGIAIIENVFLALPTLGGHPVPIIIASFGAAAILEYNAIDSPLSQPRNLVFGHFLSAVIGIGITKLFAHLPPNRFEDLRWLAGALSVGAASTVMGMTKTVHPPAGATALLAATTPEMTNLGWWLLPLVLLASSLMLASAMLVNNLYKRFPLYWWTPADLEKFTFGGKDKDDHRDVEKKASTESESGESDNTRKGGDMKKERQGSDQMRASHSERGYDAGEDTVTNVIRIDRNSLHVPDWLNVGQVEMQVLQDLQEKLEIGWGRNGQ